MVDVAGGPGVDFIDIPPAIAAAADGDTLILRAGSYGAVTLTGKGLTVLGAEGVLVRSVGVYGLAVGQRAVIADLTAIGPWFLPLPGVTDCQGPVLLERVDWRADVPLPGVTNSRDVRISESELQKGLSVVQSEVSFTDCRLEGPPFTLFFPPTLRVQDSVVSLSRCTVVGVSEFIRVASMPAITMAGASVVRVTDDGSNSIASGSAITPGLERSAVEGVGTFIP